MRGNILMSEKEQAGQAGHDGPGGQGEKKAKTPPAKKAPKAAAPVDAAQGAAPAREGAPAGEAKKKGRQDAGRIPEGKAPTPRLEETFRKTVTPALMKKFGYTSIMQVPKIEKIALNIGAGAATADAKILDTIVKELESVVGQKAVLTRSRKAISNFKLREGMPIGVRVTLRRRRMYEFLDRFVSVAVPRIRDFRGFSDRSFDGRGNYTVGIKEQIIFPEIDVDKITRVFGMDVTIVTTARTDQEALELLKGLGFPFVKPQEAPAPMPRPAAPIPA
jgi:large subunit ribosomal protein L5